MLIIDEKELLRLKTHGWKVEELGARRGERQVYRAAEDVGRPLQVISWGTGKALQDVAALEGFEIEFELVLLEGRDIVWIWKDGYFQAVILTPPDRKERRVLN